MTLVSTNVKLPRWATLIRPQAETALNTSEKSPDKDELEEEELYVRKRCFQILAKQMDDAMDSVLDDSLAPCVSTLEHFLDAAAPTLQQPSRKRQKVSSLISTNSATTEQSSLEGLDTNLFDQQQQTQTSHDPLLLPVILLQGPSFGADRRAQINCLAKNVQKARGRSAVVQVQLSDAQGRFQGMQELVRQCHCLSPVLSSGPLYRRIARRKKKRSISFSDLLLLWAQSVSDIDELVVFLTADEAFYSADLQDFLHVLAARRAEQGIPISVVMLAPPEGRRNMELGLQGYAGFAIRSLTLPSCDRLLHQFWKRMWIDLKLPILFPRNVLEAMERSFLHHTKSSQRTLHKFRQVLANRFVQKGSFLAVAHHPLVLDQIWQRMAWFLADAGARGLLVGDEATNVTSTQMLEAAESYLLECQNAQLSLQLVDSMHNNKNDQALLLFQSSFSSLFSKRSRRDLLEKLVNLRKQIDEGKDAAEETRRCHQLLTQSIHCVSFGSAGQLMENLAKRQSAGKHRLINELIVLVGNCRDGDDLSEIGSLFDEVLASRVNNTPREEPPSQSLNWGADPTSNEWSTMADSLAPQPRKHMVAALLQVPEAWEYTSTTGEQDRKHPPLAYISGIMYRLIHDRVAVTQEDWFEEFWQHAIVESDFQCPREESFSLFSLGLRYLKQCGLIVEKLRVGSRSDIIYERAKLVWCATYQQ